MDDGQASGDGSDVFLSYKREDRARVEPIVARLRELGLSVWFDASLKAGETFDEEIARELAKARSHMVCWTAASVASRWVRSEAHFGAGRNILVPAFLEPCSLLPPFNLDHTVDLSDWQGDVEHRAWQDVLHRIGALLGRGASLQEWDRLRVSGTSDDLKTFLAHFPEDPLNRPARMKAFDLEMTAARERLVLEFGVSATDQTADGSTERYQRLTKALRASEAQIERLTATAEALRAEVAVLESKRATAEAELRQAANQLSVALAEASRMGVEAKRLGKQLQLVETRVAAIEADKTKLNAALIDAQSRNDTQSAIIDELRKSTNPKAKAQSSEGEPADSENASRQSAQPSSTEKRQAADAPKQRRVQPQSPGVHPMGLFVLVCIVLLAGIVLFAKQ